ncbi:hypothetical protein N7454_010776 [Penicillium verhagenii]|nr:hypothetical protein N7454_010776 [Penicillium verhagenii]
MSKTKVSSKAEKPSKTVNKVKESKAAPAKVTKKVAAKDEKSKKNKKKEPTPSSSESESSESEEESSSSSESEEEKPVAKKAEKKVAKKEESSSESSDSESDEEMKDGSSSSSESEDEKPVAKKAEKPAAKKAEKKVESSSESESSDSESESEDEKPAAKKAEKKEESGSDSDSSESESEAKAEKESSDSDSSDSESESEESEDTAKASKKRKADDEIEAPVKKNKTEEVPEGASANLFVGNLSWNVDEEWLQREFSEFGEVSCRVVTDRESGRSRGFGYAEFVNVADAVKAFEAKKGVEMDGRTINLDYATARQNNQGGDRAQARANTYGDQTSPASDTLFVGNLPFSATEDALRDVFGEQGNIMGIRLPTDPESGRPKGFGYVQFGSVEEAQNAHTQLAGTEIDGRPLRLDFSTPRPAGGDRGGFGGRGGGGGGFGGRGGGGRGGGRGRGGFGGRGGGDRGGFGGRGGGGFGGRGGLNKAKGSIPEFKGTKVTF